MVKKIEIPQDATLVASRSELYYADCFTSLVPSHLSCLELYYSLTANLPKWVTLLFTIRDIIVKPFGVKPVEGFGCRQRKDSVKTGDHVDFFIVQSCDNDLMILSIKDVHLDVMVELKRGAGDDVKEFFVTSSVRVHNWVGKCYMTLIAPWHRYIVTLILKRVSQI